jgi:hypothetical protein
MFSSFSLVVIFIMASSGSVMKSGSSSTTHVTGAAAAGGGAGAVTVGTHVVLCVEKHAALQYGAVHFGHLYLRGPVAQTAQVAFFLPREDMVSVWTAVDS